MYRQPLRALIVAPHPDDEVLGAGVWMARHRHSPLHVVHLTDGSPRDLTDARRSGFETREQYANARRNELADALTLVGIGPDRCTTFNVPDQETHRNLPSLLDALCQLIEAVRPTMVLSPAYEGGHPDHDSAAFVVAQARRRRPFLHWEFPLYHTDRRGHIVAGRFLGPPRGWALHPSRAERSLKQRMLGCFRTQQDILSQVTARTERFRPALHYNFRRSPHPGVLLYERWGWGIYGKDWRESARQAADF